MLDLWVQKLQNVERAVTLPIEPGGDALQFRIEVSADAWNQLTKFPLTDGSGGAHAKWFDFRGQY